MNTTAYKFEQWQEELEKLQSNVKKELENIRKSKEEVQQIKQELMYMLEDVPGVSLGKYIRDDNRIIISAPEIIIGNVDADGVLWNGSSSIVLRGTQVSLEASGQKGASTGTIISRASRIHSVAEDPGADGTEHVVQDVSEVVSQAKAISLKSENAKGTFTTHPSAGTLGIEFNSETTVQVLATLSNSHKADHLKQCCDVLNNRAKDLESSAKDLKKQVESRMKDLKGLLDFDNMVANQVTARTSFLDIDELYENFNSDSVSLYSAMAEYFRTLSALAETNRQLSCIEEMKKDVDKKKSTFKDTSTGTSISMLSERVDAYSMDGDGNYRENPEAGVSITARNVSIASTMQDESLQKDGNISLSAQNVDISTVNSKVERNSKGEITKGDYPAVGNVRIASKSIALESLDYEWKDKKKQEKALAKDGSLSIRVENTELSATETEGKATGRVEVNAKKVEIKSVDVDQEKRTEKSLATGSSMLLLSEKMLMGSRDSKTRSKQMQMVSDQTAILADTTLELQQDKAIVQLSGGNTSVCGGNLDLYGKTTLQGDVTAKGAISGGDLEVKNMEVKSSFKSPCTSEGMAVPGAPATGKLTAKLKEEELKAEEKK
ncbi:MAG: hypothetical protein J6S05_00780 [Bacteroidaceae bacterium]|nr:hypothetical protein [Bacteroidaceae bacterium]